MSNAPPKLFYENIMVEYIDEYLLNRKQCSWTFRNKSQYHELALLEECLQGLHKITDILEKDYKERITELTKPLLQELQKALAQGNRRNYYRSLKNVAEELFRGGMGWNHIVIFIVYNAELAYQAIDWCEMEGRYEDSYWMVSQIVECACKYFDEKLTQWINQQPEDWFDFVRYSQEIIKQEQPENKRHPESQTNGLLGMKRCIGAVALAAMVGGLFMLGSKLSVQM